MSFNSKRKWFVFIMLVIAGCALITYLSSEQMLNVWNWHEMNVTDKRVAATVREYNFTGVSQEDPQLIEYIQKKLIKPPSPYPYKLSHPKSSHFSQFGQSKYADENYFHKMRDGFFIEAGAVDGEYLSNTLYFERELGWRGLLIEPFPNTYASLLKKNRKAYSINAALATSTTASKEYFKVAGGSGVLSHLLNKNTTKSIEVKSLPLYSILVALNVTVIDFLSLDIESYEVKVLKTLPWDKVKFRVMCIEVNHIPEGLDFLKTFLTGKGYSFLGVKGIDAWFGWPELMNKTVCSSC